MSGIVTSKGPSPFALGFAIVLGFLQGCTSTLGSPLAAPRRVYIQDDQFMKDGAVVNIRSGSLHYFRVPPAYWRDRIQRMKALGLNTITMYVAWNFHEEVEGHVHDLDMVGSFLDQAHEEGMMVILRPGPYICGEWEFGGLPSYLLAKEGIKLRTYNVPYLNALDRWLHTLYTSLASKAYSKGGPVIAVQIENEYGSFGNCQKNPDDVKYMMHLYELALSYFGPDILYTTIDGGEDNADNVLQQGSPWANNASVFAAIDGMLSNDYSKKFAQQKVFNAKGNSPKLWCELWVGWFTVWGDAHPANKSAFKSSSDETSFRDGVGTMIKEGASFSLYMAHGGTNFAYWSGANGDQTSNGPDSFKPDVTSYDYSSPISEAGDHNIGSDGGDLFLAVQQAISSKYGAAPQEPPPIGKAAYGSIALTESVSLFGNLDTVKTCAHDVVHTFPTFEELALPFGFMLYESQNKPFSDQKLSFNSHIVHDRVQVYVDDAAVGVAYRRDGDHSLAVPAGNRMRFLVENMGRINYGPGMYDYKGLLMKPPFTADWKAVCLPLEFAQVKQLPFRKDANSTEGGPVFRRGSFSLSNVPEDTYLDTDGFTKGLIWVNGHNIGRFWATEGPQFTLYVPAPYMQSGENEIIVLDLEGSANTHISSVASPRYPKSTEGTTQGSAVIYM